MTKDMLYGSVKEMCEATGITLEELEKLGLLEEYSKSIKAEEKQDRRIADNSFGKFSEAYSRMGEGLSEIVKESYLVPLSNYVFSGVSKMNRHNIKLMKVVKGRVDKMLFSNIPNNVSKN